MQRLSSGSLIICALTLALPAAAQVEHPPVPVEKAAYHWPVFSNEHVMVLRVYFPPGRGSNYHIHSLDQISVQVEAGANAGQVPGEAPTPARPGTKGQVSFTAYSKKTFIHRSTNTAATPYQNIVIALMDWGGPPKDPKNPGPNEWNTVHSIAISADRRLFVIDRGHEKSRRPTAVLR